MANPKGTPENLKPLQAKNDQPMVETVSFRATKEMKEAIMSQPDPPEFCRQAIQKALDEQKS